MRKCSKTLFHSDRGVEPDFCDGFMAMMQDEKIIFRMSNCLLNIKIITIEYYFLKL